MNIAEMTNSELEEMGLPTPCDCRNMDEGPNWWQCRDCGAYGEVDW